VPITTSARLEGRCAVVTGAGFGIGRAYAHRLGAEGAAVVIAELDREAGEQVAKELGELGIPALAVQTDVADEAAVKEMAAQAVARFGKIDVLVNNAAMWARVPAAAVAFDELTAATFDQVMRVNVTGSFLCSQAVLPSMKANQYGKIINIGSAVAFKGAGGAMVPYTTSKAAIIGLTRSLARTLGDFGIRVNCLAPGGTMTEEEPTSERVSRYQDRSQIRALKKIETPDDLVGVVAFLASSDSDFITGQTIVVDGGDVLY
jgi:3-oxoacyl-[acyl-carrier protein] reductase